MPVVGCERAQRPLLACDLTLALPNPHQTYLVNVTALLEGWTPGSALLEGIEPIRESKLGGQPHPPLPQRPSSSHQLSSVSSLPSAKLDPPRLVVTPCGKGALCVDVLPPVENLRNIYQELSFQLEIKAAGTLHKTVGLQDSPALLPLPLTTTCV